MFFGKLIAFGIAASMLALAFWVWMLVACIHNNTLSKEQKVLWVFLVACTHLVGAFIYFLYVHKRMPGVVFPGYTANASTTERAYPFAQQGYRQRDPVRPFYQTGEAQMSSDQPPYERPQAEYPEQHSTD